ncbi:MAG: DUF3383 family protein, partial [Fusobacteriaceae bacterium]
MADIVNIQFEDRTKPLTEVGLNKILVLLDDVTMEYQETNNTATLTDLPVDSKGFEVLEVVLAQAKQDVAVLGVLGLTGAQIKTALNAVTGKDFFFIVPALTLATDIKEIAEWATANERMAICTPDMTLTAIEMETLAKDINSDNVGLFVHAGTSTGEQVYLNAGITGLMSPKQAGSATWALKSPNLMPKNYFSYSDENALINGSVNVYAEELGRGITKFGATTSGTHLDITHGKYWLKNKLRAELSMLLMNRDKVPFTTTGRTLIMDAIDKVV